jgi:hypothetical protein
MSAYRHTERVADDTSSKRLWGLHQLATLFSYFVDDVVTS